MRRAIQKTHKTNKTKINETKQTKRKHHQDQACHPKTRETYFIKGRKTEKKGHKTKTQQNHIHSKQTQQLGVVHVLIVAYVDRFYLPVDLVPCPPSISFLLPSTVVSLRLFPLPCPFPWTPPITDAWRFLLNVASFSCHLTMNRSAASRTHRCHFPAFFAAFAAFAAMGHGTVSINSKHQRGVFRRPPRGSKHSEVN